MQAVGIIAEFNPFHNGHLHLIRQARALSGADYVIVVMSPDFVQRGVFAVTDKYVRTRMALKGGADLVLELPVCCALGSAEYFARAGVRLLDALGVVDTLCFGSEGAAEEDQALLWELATVLEAETPEYRTALKSALSAGLSFPAAREQALTATLPSADSGRVHALLSRPNSILGLEYLRSLLHLQSPMTPLILPRLGEGYHSLTLPEDSAFASASALRGILTRLPEDPQAAEKALSPYLPAESLQLLLSCVQEQGLPQQSRLDLLMHYRLLSESDYGSYLDVTPELSRRIRHLLPGYTGFASFAQTLKTRDMTYTRICRALLHILLQIRPALSQSFRDGDGCYARILGFRSQAGPLLHAIRQNNRIPLLAKPADAGQKLPPKACRVYENNTLASQVYRLLLPQAGPDHEALHSPILL